MAECPCCSKKEYDDCCGPLLKRKADAETAEALMRSRYTAFTMCDVDYIERTRHPRSKDKFDEDGVRQWAENSDWKGLEILKTNDGQKDDNTGEVEFIARYAQDGEDEEHREKALFQKEDSKWYFVDGDAILPETFVRETPKVGRNEPCPCGSGKKFKKCCGK